VNKIGRQKMIGERIKGKKNIVNGTGPRITMSGE
jgi:hypothetical protein